MYLKVGSRPNTRDSHARMSRYAGSRLPQEALVCVPEEVLQKLEEGFTVTRYIYQLPASLPELVLASEANEPVVEQLRQLTRHLATYQAACDWPTLRQSHAAYEKNEIMQAAKEACSRFLLQPMQQGTAITNNLEAFSMLFIQAYVGAYERILEMSVQSTIDMHDLVVLLGHLTEVDAVHVLDELTRRTEQAQP